MSKTPPFIAILATVALLGVTGCGDDGSGGGGYGSAEDGATRSTESEVAREGAPSSGDGTVAVAENPALGTILVDSRGFTLYDFHKDKGGKSACYAACAGTWPPLIAGGAPRATNGAQSSKLGTTKRDDGTMQVTYAGHPLYTYAADTKPGDAKGQDIDSFGAEWYALQPSGAEAED